MNLLNKILVFSLVVIFFLSCKEENKTSVKIEQKFEKEGTLQIHKDSLETISLDIEVADDEYERQTGLMHRASLEENQGMLFIFEEELPRSFYMKNTYIPLDILFINAENKIVSFKENAEPIDETSLPSNAPAKYVLEINGGLIERWGLEVGDKISFTLAND